MAGTIRHRTFAWLQSRFFYGWTIVGVAHLGIFVSGPGQSHTFSVFVEPISRDLGISSATIATAYGLATLGAAFALPQMGRLVDRYGPRRMLALISVLLGVVCMGFGAVSSFLWLTIGFAFLRFFGQGSLMLTSANLVSHWFDRKRGLAMSLMALGFGLSMAVHPPLAQFLVAEIGWRQAWIVLGAYDLGDHAAADLAPGARQAGGCRPGAGRHGPAGGVEAEDTALSGLSLREALRTSSFYILAAGWFAIAMLVTTLHFYQVTLLTGQGVSPGLAAYLFTMSALTMAVTMPLVGILFDRYPTHRVFAIGLGITAASLVAVTLATNAVTAVAYAWSSASTTPSR